MQGIASRNRTEAIHEVADLDAFYVAAERLEMSPGWMRHDRPIRRPETPSIFLAIQWRYAEARAALDVAEWLIDVKLAERRNLVLRNPNCANRFDTLRTLVCAYQLILPGEKARSHRHAAHALRVILDAKEAYSIVDGEKTPMESGDIVLTPGGCWHEHGHDGDRPAYWLDILDAPLASLVEAQYVEEHPNCFEPNVRRVTESPFRFTAASISRRLEEAGPDPDGLYGPTIILEVPQMPTLRLTVSRLEAGARTPRHRSNANRVFCILQGSGETKVGDNPYRWQRGDLVAVPSWQNLEQRAESGAVLLQATDEPVMRSSRYYRFVVE